MMRHFFSTILMFSIWCSTVAAQDAKLKTIDGQIKLRVDGKWTSMSLSQLREAVKSGKAIEMEVRGWLFEMKALQPDSDSIFLLDVGDVSWVLDFGEDRELLNSLSKLNHAYVVVQGTCQSPQAESLTVRNIARAKDKNRPTYVQELELQVAKLFRRLNRMHQANQEREMDVELPPVAEPLARREIVVSIDAKGSLRLKKKKVSSDELRELLEGEDSDGVGILIEVDRRAEFQYAVEVMSLCNRLNLVYSITVAR